VAKRIIRKKTEKVKSKKEKFEVIKPIDVEDVVPHTRYIVKLDCEGTKFLVTFKNDQVIQCMALDGTFETITIPISQFNRGKYTFEYEEDGETKKYIAKIEVFSQS